MRTVAGQIEKGLFQRGGIRALLQARNGVAYENPSGAEDRDAIGKKLDFLERVRGKEQSGVAGFQYTVLEKIAKLGGGYGVKAASRFIKKQDAGTVQKGAGQAEALDGSGGERAHLAIESVLQRELLRDGEDARGSLRRRQMIEPGKKDQIFARRKAGIETQIAAGMESQTSAHRAGFPCNVVTGDARGAACGKEKRGQDTKQRGFAGAVRTEQSNGFP